MAFRPWHVLSAAALTLLTACGQPAVGAATAGATAPSAMAARGFTGDIRHLEGIGSKYLSAKRDVWVYLPPGYDAAAKAGTRYPVLYMHDGNNVFDGASAFGGHEWGADETAEKLIRDGSVPPFIIVGVGNTSDRTTEYTWVKGEYAGKTLGGKGQDYAKFLVSELKPRIDQSFRTKPGRENTAVLGSSLGGLMDLYLGRYESDVFGKIGVMSPSVWWSDRAVLLEVPKMPTNLDIWLDMGWKEGSDAEQSLQDARDLKTALVKRGYAEGRNMAYYEDREGGHNEQAWAYRLPMAIQFLMGNGPSRGKK